MASEVPWIAGLQADLEAAKARARSLVEHRTTPEGWDRWRAAAAEWVATQRRLEKQLADLRNRLAANDAGAVDEALAFLEADPYFHGSGYERNKLARTLALAAMDSDQRARARSIALRWVDGEIHCGRAGAVRLARQAGNNAMRRSLRERLHSSDDAVARRAVQALVHVKHPGYTTRDLAAAREIMLRAAARDARWFCPVDYRVAMRLWSPEWGAELDGIARHHGPYRAAAKKIVEAAGRRRRAQRRAGS